MRDDRAGVPTIDAENTEVATPLRTGAQYPACGPCRERDLQFHFLGERRQTTAHAYASRLQADIAIGEDLVGAAILPRLDQPAYSGTEDVIAVGT